MKTDHIGYKNIYLKGFAQLRSKLMLIFTDNPNSRSFKFYGVENKGLKGLLVDGVDSNGISDFSKFYSIPDINFYYNSLNRRLSR